MQADTLIYNVRVAGCDQAADAVYGESGADALAVRDGRITWLGAAQDAPEASQRIDGGGGWLTPGLIDCHTHLVYGGNRAAEFAQRQRGVAYEDIARRGGGILSTVTATRELTESDLLEASLPRLQALAREGVTTVEIKSGYGLDLEHELKMLRVARALGSETGINVVTTLLAAHALPPEYSERSDDYIDMVCDVILPAAAESGLADAVDVFCERIAFSPQQCRRVFDAAQRYDLLVKGHVEQLSHSGGAALVAEYGGLSADHVEYLEDDDVTSLLEAGTVAVLLPGAFYTLGETRKPPILALREAGVPMAVASDLNPGSSPLASLLLNMNMACVQFGLTAEEALLGVTCHAARALDLSEHKGSLSLGFDADMVLWDVDDPAELSYGYGLVSPAGIWRGGRRVV